MGWRLKSVIGVLLHAEQLDGAVGPEEQGPSTVPLGLFQEVGPLVDDWEKYLKDLAESLDKQNTDTSVDISSTHRRKEDDIFLQVGFLLVDLKE